MASKTKTSLLPIIKAHLDLVIAIADKKVENTLSCDNVSLLSHDKILELFVQVDSSLYLKCKKERERKRHVATAALMDLSGTHIAQKYKAMGPK